MKKVVLIACGILSCMVFNNLFAQTKTTKVSITPGPEVDVKRSSVSDICGSDDNGYYMVRMEKKSYFLEHLTKDMVADKSLELVKQKVEDRDANYVFAKMLGEHLYVFFEMADMHKFVLKLFYQEVDKASLTLKGTLTEIAKNQFPGRKKMNSFIMTSGSYFPHSVSPGANYLMIYSLDMGTTDDDVSTAAKSGFHVDIYNESMTKDWEKDVTIPYTPELFTVNEIKVDDKGDAYFIGKEYQEKAAARASRQAGEQTFTYHVYRYSNKGQDELAMPLNLKVNFITDLQIDGADNGDLIVCGFYSDKGAGSIKGAFYMRVDGKTQQVTTEQESDFGIDFITQYYTEKQAKKAKNQDAAGKDPELSEFRLDELLMHADGGATMVAEQFFIDIITYTTTDAKGNVYYHTSYKYNYNDIIVISFDKDGNLLWKTKIPKRQCTTDDGGYYSSYTFATIDDKIYFIFNDNPKNLYLADGKPAEPCKFNNDMCVVLVEVDASGKATRELMMTSDDTDLRIRPKMSEQTGERELLLLGEKSKMYQFSKITFK